MADNHVAYSDNELLSLCMQGDKTALAILITRYTPVIKGYVLSLIKNEEMAKDFTQDIIIKIIDKIQQGKYKNNGSFRGWAFTVARNLIGDDALYYKRYINKNIINLQDDMVPDSEIYSSSNIEEEDLFLSQLFEKLNPSQKQIIQMHYYQKMTFRTIAETLNIGINTALARNRYAILNMKKWTSMYNVLKHEASNNR